MSEEGYLRAKQLVAGKTPPWQKIVDTAADLIQAPESFLRGATFPVPEAIEFGLNKMMGPMPEEGKPREPKTGIGQAANIGAGIAGGFYGIPKAAVSGAAAPFRTGPTRMGIKDLLTKGRSAAYTGAQKVKEAVPGFLKGKNAQFGDMIEGAASEFKRSDLVEVVENTIKELGLDAKEILTNTDKAVLSLRDKIPQVAQEVTSPILDASGRAIRHVNDLGKEVIDIPSVQAFIKNVRRMIPESEHALTVFYSHLGEKLSATIPDLVKAKEAIKPAYKTAKESKKIGRGALGRIARGIAPDEEIKALKSVEGPLGTQSVSSAERIGKDLTAQRNKLEKIIGRQKVLKGTAKAAGYTGLSGLGYLGYRELKKLLGG